MEISLTAFRATALLVAVVFCSVAVAGDRAVIDKRNRTEPHHHEVHFCYRDSPKIKIPGHTYVGFLRGTANGISYRAFGATAKSILDIFDGEGYLKPEYASDISQDCLIVQLNKDDFERGWSMATPLFTEPEYAYWNYHITDRSCVSYARSVAETIGLVVNQEVVPGDFIRQLKSDNPGS